VHLGAGIVFDFAGYKQALQHIYMARLTGERNVHMAETDTHSDDGVDLLLCVCTKRRVDGNLSRPCARACSCVSMLT
jgi:hypothetical protein